jgi:hypothetical protein
VASIIVNITGSRQYIIPTDMHDTACMTSCQLLLCKYTTRVTRRNYVNKRQFDVMSSSTKILNPVYRFTVINHLLPYKQRISYCSALNAKRQVNTALLSSLTIVANVQLYMQVDAAVYGVSINCMVNRPSVDYMSELQYGMRKCHLIPNFLISRTSTR